MSGTPAPASRNPKGPLWARYLLLLVWLLLGLYFGIAGWTKIEVDSAMELARKAPAGTPVTYEGLEFASSADLMVFLMSEQAGGTIFGWMLTMPMAFSMIVSAMAFGVLGNLALLVRKALSRRSLPDVQTLALSPLSGALTALLLMGAAYILPSALTLDSTVLRPTALLFVSLFAGAFSDHIEHWLGSFMDKLFPLPKEKDEDSSSTKAE